MIKSCPTHSRRAHTAEGKFNRGSPIDDHTLWRIDILRRAEDWPGLQRYCVKLLSQG
jgi:hypothetical protein